MGTIDRVTAWFAAQRAAADERQRARRQAAHDQALGAWERERRELEDAIADVEGFDGWAPSEVPGGLELAAKRGERVYLVARGAGLVEHQRSGGTWTGGYSGFSVRLTRNLRWHVGGNRGTYQPGPEEPALLDTGTVTITDRRVVFQGAKQSREWTFSKLLGYQHLDEAPITVLQVSNRQRVSGVLYDGETGETFQRRLAIAVGRATVGIDSVLAGLRAELAAHDAARPSGSASAPVPAPARPAATTSLARYRGWPTWARIGAPITAALVVLMLIAGITAPPEETELANDGEATTTTTEAERTTTTEKKATTTTEAPTTTTTEAPTTTTAPPPPPPPTTTTTAAPPPPPPPPVVQPPPAARSGGCHPSYTPCVPIASDVDCAGGEGDGPEYVGFVTVIGYDEYDLDRDGDGVGCE